MTQTAPTHDPSVDEKLHEWITTFGADSADAAYLLADRHDPAAVAFTTIDIDDDDELVTVDLTYGELADASKRFAAALAELGVGRGDRVGVLMGKRAELVVSLLAIARLGAVYVPLFTAFATPAIEMRLTAGDARVVITEPGQVDKLDGIDGIRTIVAGDEFDGLVAAHEPVAESVAVGGDGMLILLFTSGTTGAPKGVPVPVRALAAFSCYMHYGLDVNADDVFWNAADPGWAYGLYYGILGPMAIGRRNLLLHAGFSPEVTAQVLRELGVTNFAAAPTVYRSLSKDPSFTGFALRRASSAGEPLTPDVIDWARETLQTEVRDHYGQTEHGMFINNHWHPDVAQPLVPGSMGSPMPGFATGIVDGQIAIDVAHSPLLFFTGYLDAPDKTAARFTPDGAWYLTGDTGRKDDDGRYYFTARDDDVIIMAGYRIGPFDVESVLITHPSVVDVAVVGRPDELRGEVLEAFVVLAEGVDGTDALEAELQQLVKTGFAAHAYPRTVHFVDALPKTPSGKIQRFILRKQP
ncbi:AMP-binding protein [Gordonia sp. HNM0687]|uniref:AMP-binding protein n=1 Tax=Gordonia mangrovi TaxID=2665643 RepID=A0A6L7GZG9_9ACTN|nr:AMP-binding protein [Gordonia mangrovi]MXP24285.1 AMP-binding protein [Gordonia mangrovi]UVF79896.1 AMP-binding protein [Gordonia mangrovi]